MPHIAVLWHILPHASLTGCCLNHTCIPVCHIGYLFLYCTWRRLESRNVAHRNACDTSFTCACARINENCWISTRAGTNHCRPPSTSATTTTITRGAGMNLNSVWNGYVLHCYTWKPDYTPRYFLTEQAWLAVCALVIICYLRTPPHGQRCNNSEPLSNTS